MLNGARPMARAVTAISGRVVTSALCAIFALVSVLGASAFGVAAFWIYLTSAMSPLAAAVGCALVLLSIGIILVAIAKALFRPEPVHAAQNTAHDLSRSAAAGIGVAEDVIEEITGLFSRHKSAALIAAIVAGLAAGRSQK